MKLFTLKSSDILVCGSSDDAVHHGCHVHFSPTLELGFGSAAPPVESKRLNSEIVPWMGDLARRGMEEKRGGEAQDAQAAVRIRTCGEVR